MIEVKGKLVGEKYGQVVIDLDADEEELYNMGVREGMEVVVRFEEVIT